MVICLCKGVTDGKLRWLVQNGATTLRQVVKTCHAGTDCGTCACHVKEIVEKELAAKGCPGEASLDPASNE
jgi:bacterioferritin-associated ferredoxin